MTEPVIRHEIVDQWRKRARLNNHEYKNRNPERLLLDLQRELGKFNQCLSNVRRENEPYSNLYEHIAEIGALSMELNHVVEKHDRVANNERITEYTQE